MRTHDIKNPAIVRVLAGKKKIEADGDDGEVGEDWWIIRLYNGLLLALSAGGRC